jgi:hypothetical protein
LLQTHKKIYVSGVKGVAEDELHAHFSAFGVVVGIVPHGRGVIVEFGTNQGAQMVCPNLLAVRPCKALKVMYVKGGQPRFGALWGKKSYRDVR